jgi:hypothetical protein
MGLLIMGAEMYVLLGSSDEVVSDSFVFEEAIELVVVVDETKRWMNGLIASEGAVAFAVAFESASAFESDSAFDAGAPLLPVSATRPMRFQK